jgi:small conductance mechanosensitive channel
MEVFWDAFLEIVGKVDVIQIIVIVVSGVLGYLFFGYVLTAAVHRGLTLQGKRRHSAPEAKKRAKTLSSVLRNILALVITLVVIFMLLADLGVNIAPLLTGAGILGVAIGFGSQTLVKDVLSGLFILVEDQFDFGDRITVAGLTGTVEELNLRRTVIRDESGVEHYIPNSQITVVSNATKHSSAISVDVPVKYDADLKKVMAVAQEVTDAVSTLAEFQDIFLKKPEVLGVMHYTTDGMLLRIRGRSLPHTNSAYERKLREELQTQFRHAKIPLGASSTIVGS